MCSGFTVFSRRIRIYSHLIPEWFPRKCLFCFIRKIAYKSEALSGKFRNHLLAPHLTNYGILFAAQRRCTMHLRLRFQVLRLFCHSWLLLAQQHNATLLVAPFRCNHFVSLLRPLSDGWIVTITFSFDTLKRHTYSVHVKTQQAPTHTF